MFLCSITHLPFLTHLCEVEADFMPGVGGLLVALEVVDLVVGVVHHAAGYLVVPDHGTSDLGHLSLDEGAILPDKERGGMDVSG